MVMATRIATVGGTVHFSNVEIALYPNRETTTWTSMTNAPMPAFSAKWPSMESTRPTFMSRAVTRSRTTHVLIAHQPTTTIAWMTDGR